MAEMQLLLKDHVALLRVGVNADERKAPQRVRISIAATLRHLPQQDALDATYDYTRMLDAIVQLSGTHYDLLESLAHDLAGRIMTGGDILRVEIELLKLDIIASGQLGVRYSAP